MKKKLLCILLILAVISVRSVNGQISIVRPSGIGTDVGQYVVTTNGTFDATNWSNLTENLSNLGDGNSATTGTIGIKPNSSSASTNENPYVMVSFNVTGNNGVIYIRYDKEDNLFDKDDNLLTVSSSPGTSEAQIILYDENGNEYTDHSEYNLKERTLPNGSTVYAVYYSSNYQTITKMAIKFKGDNGLITSNYERTVDIQEIYWYSGTASLTDCGQPVSTAVASTYAGVPLGGYYPVDEEKSIDGDNSTYAVDMTSGLGGIGFFYFSHHIYFNGPSNNANSAVRAIFGNGVGINVSLTGSIYKIQFLKKGSLVSETSWRTYSVLNVLGIQDYSAQSVLASSNGDFDEINFQIGIAGVNISVLSAGLFRVYEVQRVPAAPSINNGSTVYTTYGTPATLTATGVGDKYVWHSDTTESYQVYTPDEDGDVNNDADHYVNTTSIVPYLVTSLDTTTANMGSNGYSSASFTTDPLYKDDIFFVQSLLLSCSNIPSDNARIDVLLISTAPTLTASVNASNTGVVLNWSVAHEYKSTGMQVQRRVSGSNDDWTVIEQLTSSADADADASNLHTNTSETPTTYSYTDLTVDPDQLYEYRILVLDRANEPNLVYSNIAVQSYTLPVVYEKELSANRSGATTVLNWSTSHEVNNKGFHIMRSHDGKSWVEIGFAASKGDINNTITKYTYNDYTATAPIAYYQLKQEDIDGGISLGNIVSVGNNLANYVVLLYPNPVQDILNVSAKGYDKYRILDLNGNVLLSGRMNSNGIANISVMKLPAGSYIIELLSSDEKKQAYKFLKK